MIRMDSYISRSHKIAWQIIDEETLVVTPTNSTLHVLNRTGTRIWELMEKRVKIEDIVDKICSEFDVEEKQAKKGILKFIEELVDKGVVSIENGKST